MSVRPVPTAVQTGLRSLGRLRPSLVSIACVYLCLVMCGNGTPIGSWFREARLRVVLMVSHP